MTDGSFAGAAVRSCADGRGVVLGWRARSPAFAKKSVLSMKSARGTTARSQEPMLLSDSST